MSYRIAIASTDGKVVNQHFGRAEYFYIGEVDENLEFHLLEKRTTKPVCQGGEHETDSLETIADSLSDCRYCLVSQIGPVAEIMLGVKGVTVLVIRNFIDDAITKLIDYDRKVNIIYPLT